MNQNGQKPTRPAEPPKRVGKGNGCPHYKKCGGCQLQNMTYAQQLKHKQIKVVGLLGKFCRVNEIIGMQNPLHYRCKVQAAFAKDKTGIISGVYQSSTHRIVPIDTCNIEDEQADAIIVTIRKLLKSFKLKPFDERTMSGFLRHVLVRKGYYTGQIVVVLVTGSAVFPSRRSFVNALVGKHPEITTVVQNINGKFTSLVLGDKNITLYGDGYIEDTIKGYSFRISPKSFYQVNPVMTTVLYGKALEYMELTGRETVIDAYCGTGTIGILASQKAERVIGVELNADAVRDAKTNAKRNDIKNIEFYTADAGDFMVEMAEAGEKADVVIMDPPRAGSDQRFMRSVLTLAPQRVVYVSCNPETLARDLKYFVRNGYAVRRAQPVDMFPHTDHVETVVCLSKKNSVDKKQAFFENAKLLSEKLGIVPLMYGSLGLEYLTGEKLNAEDIDILIPKAFVTKRWGEFRALLESQGYTLTDEREHEFEKDGVRYSYAQVEELESFAGIRLSEISTLRKEGTAFQLLSLPQYLKVYTTSSKDGYRVKVREKKDLEKIAFIRKHIAKDER